MSGGKEHDYVNGYKKGWWNLTNVTLGLFLFFMVLENEPRSSYIPNLRPSNVLFSGILFA